MILASTVITIATVGQVSLDRLGKPVLGEVARGDVLGRLEQSGSVEGSEYAVGRFIAYLPADAVITSADRVIEGGRTFAVEGSPERRSLPGFLFLDHIQATLNHIGG